MESRNGTVRNGMVSLADRGGMVGSLEWLESDCRSGLGRTGLSITMVRSGKDWRGSSDGEDWYGLVRRLA